MLNVWAVLGMSVRMLVKVGVYRIKRGTGVSVDTVIQEGH